MNITRRFANESRESIPVFPHPVYNPTPLINSWRINSRESPVSEWGGNAGEVYQSDFNRCWKLKCSKVQSLRMKDEIRKCLKLWGKERLRAAPKPSVSLTRNNTPCTLWCSGYGEVRKPQSKLFIFVSSSYFEILWRWFSGNFFFLIYIWFLLLVWTSLLTLVV